MKIKNKNYLCLSFYPEEFSAASTPPQGELRGVKRCLDTEFELEILNSSFRDDTCGSISSYATIPYDYNISDNQAGITELDIISVPEGGIIDIPVEKLIHPNETLITLADVQQANLKATPVLPDWLLTNLDKSIEECWTNPGITPMENVYKNLDMDINLNNIVEWDVPDVCEHQEDDDITVLFEVTETVDVTTQTTLNLCPTVDVETQINLNVIQTVDMESQTSLDLKQTVVVETQTHLDLNQTGVVGTQTHLELLQIKDVDDEIIRSSYRR